MAATHRKQGRKREEGNLAAEELLASSLFGARAWSAVRLIPLLPRPGAGPSSVFTNNIPEAPVEKQTSRDQESEEERAPKRRRVAWVDPDDDQLTVSLVSSERRLKLRHAPDERTVDAGEYASRLVAQRGKLAGGADPSWALVRAPKEDAGATTALKVAVRGRDAPLEAGKLLLGRLPDANRAEYAKSAVASVAFHPQGELLLVAGLDRTLRLFAADERDEESSKLQSVHVADLPLSGATWARGGAEVLLAGAAPHFYAYDVAANSIERLRPIPAHDAPNLSHVLPSPDGSLIAAADERGRVLLLEAGTKQVVGEVDVATPLTGLAWADSTTLLASGRGGDLFALDVKQRRCVRRWEDAGAVHTTCLATSQGGGWLATGQDAGVVNLWRHPLKMEGTAPAAPRSLLNLTTPITSLLFNPDAQLLAMATKDKRNGLRLVHTGTGTVYANFPKKESPLGRVSALAFAPDSTRLAVGNAHGKVLLYKLHHYA